jgi:hypothetical protein
MPALAPQGWHDYDALKDMVKGSSSLPAPQLNAAGPARQWWGDEANNVTAGSD